MSTHRRPSFPRACRTLAACALALSACSEKHVPAEKVDVSAFLNASMNFEETPDGVMHYAGVHELRFSNKSPQPVQLTNLSAKYAFEVVGSSSGQIGFGEIAKEFPATLPPGATKAITWPGSGTLTRGQKYRLSFDVDVDGEKRHFAVPLTLQGMDVK